MSILCYVQWSWIKIYFSDGIWSTERYLYPNSVSEKETGYEELAIVGKRWESSKVQKYKDYFSRDGEASRAKNMREIRITEDNDSFLWCNRIWWWLLNAWDSRDESCPLKILGDSKGSLFDFRGDRCLFPFAAAHFFCLPIVVLYRLFPSKNCIWNFHLGHFL